MKQTEYDDVLRWFIESSKFELQHDLSQKEYESKILSVTPLKELVLCHLPNHEKDQAFFAMELVRGLVQNKKLSKKQMEDGVHFQDNYGSFIAGM